MDLTQSPVLCFHTLPLTVGSSPFPARVSVPGFDLRLEDRVFFFSTSLSTPVRVSSCLSQSLHPWAPSLGERTLGGDQSLPRPRSPIGVSGQRGNLSPSTAPVPPVLMASANHSQQASLLPELNQIRHV